MGIESNPKDGLAPLEKIPFYLLEIICEFLAYCDRRRESLFAFSLASKTCNDAAVRQRFGCIHLTVRSPEKLRLDLEQWNTLLCRHGGLFRCVRLLKITGRMRFKFMVERVIGQELRQVTYVEEDVGKGVEDNEEKEAEEYFGVSEPWGPPTKPMRVAKRRWPEDCMREAERHWAPLADFISKLPGLHDLVHACTDQIAFNVLSALHEHSPNAKLHMHAFYLRSFLRQKGDNSAPDPREIALINSPCLYSVVVCYSDWLLTGAHDHPLGPFRVDHNEEVMMRMMAGLAPRLTHVKMEYTRGCGVTRGSARQFALFGRFYQTPRTDSETFFPRQPQEIGKGWGTGGLRSLKFPGNHRYKRSGFNPVFSSWTGLTAFEKLHVLNIDRYTSLETIQALTSMSRRGGLACLRSLALNVQLEWNNPTLEEADQVCGQLVQSLLPLEELHLRGLVGVTTYHAAKDHHGRSLRKLTFITCVLCPQSACQAFVVPQARIKEINEEFPGLRCLSISIPRTHGDEQETAMYQAIGGLTYLQSLSLTLDFSRGYHDCLHREQPSFHLNIDSGSEITEEEWSADVAVVREALVNTAIDSTLAEAIFHLIRGTNGTSGLAQLRLDCQGIFVAYGPMGWPLNRTVVWALGWICRDWLVTTHAGHGGKLRIKRLNRVSLLKEEHLPNIQLGPKSAVDTILWEAWTSIWPQSGERWMDDWSSLPLRLPLDTKET